MGHRFGRLSRRGVSLCFEEMTLTHRNLAEISGLTRVTVTKAISSFRQSGALLREGADEWLFPKAWARGQPGGKPQTPGAQPPGRQDLLLGPLANQGLLWVLQLIMPPYQQHCQSCGRPIPKPCQSSLRFANS